MCGIFGIYAPNEDVARLSYFGLYALQHRGQESAGIAVSTGSDIILYKEMGLVTQVFDEKILSILKGDIAIGHIRYSTTGSSTLVNAQPILIKDYKEPLALAHNGNLVNTASLKKRLQNESMNFTTTSDSELIAHYIGKALENNNKIEVAIKEVMHKLKGAYSLVILTKDKLIGVRDPLGIRPLCVGKFNSSYVLSSETCGLDVLGAKFIKEVDPGEIVIIDKTGMRNIRAIKYDHFATCIFEFIYFARPDSYIYDKLLHTARYQMGAQLAKEHPVSEADLVVPIPDSSISAAIGYATYSGIPFGQGLVKNRYIHRTFIEPDQRLRDLGVKMKLNPLIDTIKGKKLVLIDDSIVRGTTSSKIIKLLRDAGAKEVHVRVSSPPIRYPCYYGIDMAKKEELIASSRNIEEIREELGADSLSYLSIQGLIDAVNLPPHYFCLACFNEVYPIKVPKQLELSTKFVLEKRKKEQEIILKR